MKDVEKADYYEDYDKIIDSFGVEVLVRIDDGEYSGDTFLLVRDSSENGRIGIIFFGWGSCSGCDALLMCNQDPDPHLSVERLRDEIWTNARWRKDTKSMLEYVTTKDWGLEVSSHTNGWERFYGRALEWLISNSK